LAEDIEVRKLICLRDSQLAAGQVNGTFQVKDPLLMKYYYKVFALLATFESIKVEHIPRTSNSQVDILSKLAIHQFWL